jgi:hypothetical protein
METKFSLLTKSLQLSNGAPTGIEGGVEYGLYYERHMSGGRLQESKDTTAVILPAFGRGWT